MQSLSPHSRDLQGSLPPSLPPSLLTCVLVSSISEPSISFFSACSRPNSFSPAANVSGPRPFTLEENASRSTSGT